MLSNSSKVWVKSSFQLASLRFDSGVHHFEMNVVLIFCYEVVALTAHMQENITSYPGKTRLMPFTGQDAKEMLGRAEITITRTGQQTWVVLLSFHSLLPMFFPLGYRVYIIESLQSWSVVWYSDVYTVQGYFLLLGDSINKLPVEYKILKSQNR